MSYRVESTPGATKKLRQKAWTTQATFWAEPGRTEAFAAALLSDDPPCEHAELIVVATSRTLYLVGPLIAQTPLDGLRRDTTVTATGGEAAAKLLAAALSDYVDFWFVPKPGGFVVYADNDEYATVFAHRQGAVSRAGERLRASGFREVSGYAR